MTINNGVVLERLSGKKLSFLVVTLLILQLIFFIIGFVKFPNATHTETVEGIMCRDKPLVNTKTKVTYDHTNLYYLRDYLGRSNANCDRIEVDDHKQVVLQARQEEITYAFQIPLPRDNQVFRLHRWFQTMTCILQLQVLIPESIRDKVNNLKLDEQTQTLKHSIPLDVKLAYRNVNDFDDVWHLLAQSHNLEKRFECVRSEYSLDCDMIQLFELPTVHHQYYVINAKLGESDLTHLNPNDNLNHDESSKNFYVTKDLPEVRLTLTFIYQTGGFTQMWLIMKTLIFPFELLIMCWFWSRIVSLDRPSNLIEKLLFSLGLSICLLNLPLEWLTLYYDLKWMLLFTDLRQGIFYSTLFTFWIIFTGEHFRQDGSTSSSLKSYWKYLIGLWSACLSLLVFELVQRGSQIYNPFFDLWDTERGSRFAFGMLCTACGSAVVYFGLLVWLIGKVFFNFYSKRANLTSMNKMKRAYYEGIIYRFNFLLLSTLFCAGMTIAFFIINNINETHWRFSDTQEATLNYSGGFLTGVYGMWNIYVSAVMIFYAPSHKNKPIAQHYDATNEETAETIEFVNLQTKITAGDCITESVLTAFANKISAS